MVDPRNPCPGERQLERPRFFEGQLLTASDLQAQQDYLLDRLQSHNRLHGWGTVCGLGVEPTDPPSGKVVVGPGAALDCCGREIVVTEPIELDVVDQTPALPRHMSMFVTIAYDDQGVTPVPVPIGPEQPHTQTSRIREVPRIGIAQERPDHQHKRPLPDGVVPCPPCDDPAITLARIDLAHPRAITSSAIDNSVRCIVAQGPTPEGNTTGASSDTGAATDRPTRRTAIVAGVTGLVAIAVGALSRRLTRPA